MPRTPSDFRCLTNAAALCLLFVGTTVLALNREWIDRPLAAAINIAASDQPFAGRLAYGVVYSMAEGALVVSLLWYCWLSEVRPQLRARLVSGVCAAVLAALIAQVVQNALPPTPKPIFDPALGLHIPDILGDAAILREAPFADSPSFPSPRAVLFAGLAIATLVVRLELGLLAMACTSVVELARVVLGLHYPTNLVGSLSLGATLVWFAQTRPNIELALRIVRWERRAAVSFYLSSVLVSYLLVTTFQDLRALAAKLLQ